MKIEEFKTDLAKMSEDALRDFILENRKAQKRYREEQASQPKRAKVASITDEKKKHDKLKAMLEALPPEAHQKLLAEKGMT